MELKFYKLDEKGSISAVCVENADGKYLESSEPIVEGFDHRYYFASQLKSDSYKQRKANSESNTNIYTQINEIQQKLNSYDYIGTKIATGRATKEDYAKEIQEMNEWAEEINKLKAKLK